MPYKDKDKAREYQREYYRKNPEEVKQRVRDRRAAFASFKESLCCEVCGENEPVCLEFHHLDPTKKDFSISSQRNSSLERIMREIDKCAVLCANCHRKVHAGKIVLASR